MSVVQISPPKQLFGDTKSQLLEMNSYLFKLSEQLNVNLNNITPEKFWEETSRAVSSDSYAIEDKALLSTYSGLKSLVIKTAGDVIANSEEFRTSLSGTYLAKSQFGDYLENTTVDINGTPVGITQLYSYSAGIKSDFDDFSVSSNTYIKTGLLFYDDTTPVYGVGVGILESTTEVGGRKVLDKSNLLATYTADEIAFWGNDTKLAYITPTAVYFPSAHISGGTISGTTFTGGVIRGGSVIGSQVSTVFSEEGGMAGKFSIGFQRSGASVATTVGELNFDNQGTVGNTAYRVFLAAKNIPQSGDNAAIDVALKLTSEAGISLEAMKNLFIRAGHQGVTIQSAALKLEGGLDQDGNMTNMIVSGNEFYRAYIDPTNIRILHNGTPYTFPQYIRAAVQGSIT